MKASNPQEDLIQSVKPTNLFMGGQGSGKTWVIGAITKSYIDHFPHIRGLIAANTYGQLNKSTLFRVREFWQACGMFEYKDYTGEGDYVVGKVPPKHFNTEHHNYDRYDNIISFINGHVIYIGSLDKYQSLDGMEVAYAMLDETKDTRRAAVEEVILGRIRQPGIYITKEGKKTPYEQFAEKPFNPLYIFTSPAKVPWINEWFNLDDYEGEIMAQIFSETSYFKKEKDDQLVTISSAYLNADNLPAGWIDGQKSKLPSHLHDMLIYGSPFSRSGGEFYKCFDRTKHVQAWEYDNNLPLHISFDFNVAPYITLTIWQAENSEARQINEICLPSPDNSTRKLCQEFKRLYSTHRAGLFIYGDATGKARNPLVEEDHNHYTVIEDELQGYRPGLRVPVSNPSIVMRGNFINTVFESEFEGISIRFSPKCPHSIADYTYLKEDAEGKKLKKKVKDKQTGGTYEEFGHTSDANDYFLCEFFMSEYLAYQEPPLDASKRTFTSHQTVQKY